MAIRASRDIYLQAELHCCDLGEDLQQIKNLIAQVISVGELIPLSRDQVEVEPNRIAHPPLTNLSDFIVDNYTENSEWDAEEFSPLYPLRELRLQLRTTIENEWKDQKPIFGAQEIRLTLSSYGELYSIIYLTCTLFGEMFAFPDRALDHQYADSIAEIYRKISKALIPLLNPAYGIITNNCYGEIYGNDVLQADLKYIHWCNYFGPSYMHRYNEEVLLTAPGSQNHRLADGVWYQVSEKFMQYGDQEISQEVDRHFQPAGVQLVDFVDYSPGTK